MNRTTKYLAPSLRLNDRLKSFMDTHDISFYHGVDDEPTGLYGLINIDNLTSIPLIRSLPFVLRDYPYGNIRSDRLHIVQFECPIPMCVEWFRRGKYSRMYSAEQLERCFVHGSREYMVCRKHPVYRSIFSRDIGIDIPEDNELDSMWEEQDEILRG